jgi:hypothetical protein
MIEQTINNGGTGRSADIVAKSIMFNLIKNDEPFQVIELRQRNQLLTMMRDADFPHVYGEASTFYFSAHYYYGEDYPIGRTYFMKERDLVKIAKLYQFFKEEGIDLPIIPPTLIGEKIKESGFVQRIRSFKTEKEKQLAPFKGLFKGRQQSTTVEEPFFLNSPGCLVCGSDKFYMATSILDETLMVGFNLCEKHMESAKKESSVIDYLSKILQQKPFSTHVQPIDTQTHVDLVLSWLPAKLGCSVNKVIKNTITLQRKSDFKVVLRLDSFCNYGYMLITPDGTEVARVDSANHHNVIYGPDHVHTDLQKDKSVVESSFTTGTPMIDVVTILKLLEIHEKKFTS